jgi:hypothetical protein
MKIGTLFLWAARISWPLLGGIWGSLAGFGGYLQLAQNADSFASMFAHGFFIGTAVIGLIGGMACGGLVGGVTEKLLRHLGMRSILAVCVATIFNAVFLWQLIGILHVKFPGFRPPVQPRTASSPRHSNSPLPAGNPCVQQPPPEGSKERVSWDEECR